MKKIISIIIAVILVFSVFTLTACKKDEVTLTVTVSVYNEEDETLEDRTLTFTLYKNLAPVAIGKLTDAIKDNYFEGAVFYKADGYSSQIMLGEYKLIDGEIVKDERVYVDDASNPDIRAEFEKNGVKGSNLKNELGAIGLWREFEDGTYTADKGKTTTFINFYMPLNTISSYDGYFCVLGKAANAATTTVITDINTVLKDSDYYTSYTVYYTEDNETFTSHVVLTEDFDNVTDEVYEAEDGETQKYNKVEISVAGADYLVVKSVKIGK